MELALKRKTKKVGITHFLLSIASLGCLLLSGPANQALLCAFAILFCVLQPHFLAGWIVLLLNWVDAKSSAGFNFFFVFYLLATLLIPVWSVCFGWLCAKTAQRFARRTSPVIYQV